MRTAVISVLAAGTAAGTVLMPALAIVSGLCTLLTVYLAWKAAKRGKHQDEGQVGVGFAHEAFESLREEVSRLTHERKEWEIERRRWVDERELWHQERAKLLGQIDRLNDTVREFKDILERNGIRL